MTTRARTGWLGDARLAALAGGVLAAGFPAGGFAQRSHDSLPIRAARTISFETDQGSLMNLDLSPDGRTIVFDLLGDIYTIPITGGRATQLTRGLAIDSRPVWSPDGKRIAFASDGGGDLNLWVMASDGSGARAVAKERTFPLSFTVMPSFLGAEWMPEGDALVADDTVYHLAGGKRKLSGLPDRGWGSWLRVRFSPDGRFLYFSHDGVRRFEPATGTTVQLARLPGYPDEPVVSPDGRWLAYIDGDWRSRYRGLRIRDLETGDDRLLAHPIDELRKRDERYVFTPDSRAILIAYGGKIHRIVVATGEDTVIPFKATVNLDLGQQVYHQYRVPTEALTVRYIRSPATSPDGKTLVFTALQRLYRMALPDGKPAPLVEQPGLGQFQPAFSPDGQWIAYVTWSEVEGGQVWRVRATGGKPERLTNVAAYYQRPAWSPDGRTLAILAAGTKDAIPREAEDGWLQLLPSDGGTPSTIAARVSREYPAVFTPDGQRILIQEDDGYIGLFGGSSTEQWGPLYSIKLDGSDRKVLARAADGRQEGHILPSPDGRYLAYILREDLYLAPLPTGSDPIVLGETTGAVPVVRLTQSVVDMRWEDGGRTLSWVIGNRIYRYDRDRLLAAARDAGTSVARTTALGKPLGKGVTPREIVTVDLTAPLERPTGTIALHGARLITMKGDQVIENGTIVITGGRITAVGPSSKVRPPNGAKIVDLTGTTIIPGLVDLHAHFTWRPDERIFQRDWRYLATLAYGVTTAREVSGNTSNYGDSELIATGAMLGPRLYPSGGAILVARIESLDDARGVLQQRKALGGIFIKQYMQPTRRQRQWVLQAAAEAGLNVTNESNEAFNKLSLIQDGTTGVEHTMHEPWLFRDVIGAMAKSRVWYTPTQMNGYGAAAQDYYRYRDRRLFSDPKYRRFAPAVDPLEERRSGTLERPGDPRYLGFIENARIAAEIIHQGGYATLGSHGNDLGLGVHWELWARQRGGLTNLEALRAATIHGIEGLGLQQDLGTIEVGKLADLVVLDANPLDDIENTMAIRFVMKGGILYDGNTLDTVWPEVRKLPKWMYEQPPGDRSGEGTK